MITQFRPIKLLYVIGLAMLLVSCGGSSSSSSSSSSGGTPQNGNGNGDDPPLTTSLAPAQQVREVGESSEFVLSVSGGSGAISWTCNSTNTDIATVAASDTGCLATAVAEGFVHIQAAALRGGVASQASSGLTVLAPPGGDPVRVGQLSNDPEGASWILIKDNWLLIQTWSGLRLADLSDPVNPVHGAAVDVASYPVDMAIAGDLVLLATQTEGLRIIDISDPADPFVVGHLPSPTDGVVSAVTISGTTAYVADNHNRFLVVDISNPAQPQTIGELDITEYTTGIALGGDYAFLVNNTGLQIVDISVPGSPADMGTLPLTGGRALVYQDQHVYITGNDLRLGIVDVTNPGQPQLLLEDALEGSSGRPTLVGTRLYIPVSDAVPHLDVHDVTDPANPVDIGSVEIGAAPGEGGVAFFGRYGYISIQVGVFVFDMGDLAAPQ